MGLRHAPVLEFTSAGSASARGGNQLETWLGLDNGRFYRTLVGPFYLAQLDTANGRAQDR